MEHKNKLMYFDFQLFIFLGWSSLYAKNSNKNSCVPVTPILQVLGDQSMKENPVKVYDSDQSVPHWLFQE